MILLPHVSRSLITSTMVAFCAIAQPIQAEEVFSIVELTVDDGLPPGALDDPEGSRIVNVLVPPGWEANGSCIVLLHGGGVADPNIVWLQTNLGEIWPEAGFTAFLPQALTDIEAVSSERHNWNDGREVTSDNAEEDAVLGPPPNTTYAYRTPPRQGWSQPLYTHELDIDDVGFLSTLIDVMVNGRPDRDPPLNYGCNPDRIYLVGVSNGGFMAQRFALEQPGSVAAVVVGNATLGFRIANDHALSAVAPAPIMFMLGAVDAHVRYDDWDVYADDPPPLGPSINETWDPTNSPHAGGWVCHPDEDLDDNDCSCFAKIGRIKTAIDTAEYWAEHNSCELLDQDQIGQHTTLYRYQDGCLFDYQVLLYGSSDGGHTWPGNDEFEEWPECAQGVNDDFNGEDVMWEFLQQYPYWESDSVEECIVSETGESSEINEGFWRGKLRASSSGSAVPVIVKLRGIPILRQIPLGPPTLSNELAIMWRIYDVNDPTPPAADEDWTQEGMQITTEGTMWINLAAASKVLKGANEQWLEILVPDYDLNDDGLINFQDAGILSSYSNANPAVYAVEADFNRDGSVDDDDESMMAQSFYMQQSCGTGDPGPSEPIECPVGSCSSYPTMN